MDPFTFMLMMSSINGNRRRGARNFFGSGKSSKATKRKRLEKRRATSSGRGGSELICEDELLEMDKHGMLYTKLKADYNLAQLKEICIRNKIPRSGAKYEVCA